MCYDWVAAMIYRKHVITAQGLPLHQWLNGSTTAVICRGGRYCGSVHIYRQTSARKLDMPAPAPSLFALFGGIFQICVHKLLPVNNNKAVDTNQQSVSPSASHPICLFASFTRHPILLPWGATSDSNHGVTWAPGGRGVRLCVAILPICNVHTKSCVLYVLTCLHMIHVEGNKGPRPQSLQQRSNPRAHL